MGPQRWSIMASLLAAWVGMILGCRGGDKATENTIPYEVLKNEKHRGDGKLVLEVLVSEAASKQDVLKLAESFRQQHAGKFFSISIYDSRAAYLREIELNTPAELDKAFASPEKKREWLKAVKELQRHWLVSISVNDGEEIRWHGEGRDH